MSAAGADITEHICIIRIWMNFWKKGIGEIRKGDAVLVKASHAMHFERS